MPGRALPRIVAMKLTAGANGADAADEQPERPEIGSG